jgi:lipoprotein-anchoring transpeptidase ErfK/SrfK
MLEKERLGRYGILVNGIRTTDKHWVQWLLPPIALLSVDGRADGAQQRIMYHDAQSCECQPTDPGSVAEMITPWQQEKEQEAILRAGLASYYQRNGVMPEALEELNKPYPANVLPGVTTYMQARYEQAKAVLQTAAKANLDVPGAGAAGSLGLTSSAGSSMQPPLTEPLAQPLQIIVDKSNHRLALVSGSVIIRSYPVGLGGAKTPEGQFAITEKVRNPNGKSNGDFGSRGMTLSDTLYAIHGTNKPGSVGRDQSLGCVRMLQEDVEELFDMVPLGTKVTIGKALLPNETLKSGNPFKMPLFSEETNPKKVYKWLD